MKQKLLHLGLLFLGGVLLSLAWPDYNFILGLFVGFVPLLLLEEYWVNQKGRFERSRIFWGAFLTFAVWNGSAIWWVWNASWVGVVASVIVNSLFFAGIFLLYSRIKKAFGLRFGLLSFVALWLAWEYIEIVDWDLSWPWLTLGYALADYPWLIQWYEYTGSLGGSFWVLTINYLIFQVIQGKAVNHNWNRKKLSFLLIVAFLPVAISALLYVNYTEEGQTAEIVVVQPNIDPYSELFLDDNGKPMSRMSGADQLKQLLHMADSKIDSNTAFVLFPETALPRSIWAEKINFDPGVAYSKEWISHFPNTHLITGIVYKALYEPRPGEDIPPEVQVYRNGQFYYTRHNSALHLSADDSAEVYHKSRLVIGVERIPSYFVFLQRYLNEFDDDPSAGSYNPNHGIQSERAVFINEKQGVQMAPIICYESIFGEFVASYVQKGANVLGIITNDGWWGDTPGYKHHFAYARLRAIETRRSVARSANTGTSGFINQRGDILQASEYWKPTVLKEELHLNEKLTFYVRFGDLIGRLAVPVSLILLTNLIVRLVRRKARY